MRTHGKEVWLKQVGKSKPNYISSEWEKIQVGEMWTTLFKLNSQKNTGANKKHLEDRTDYISIVNMDF